MDFDGKVLLEGIAPVEVTPLDSKVYLEWPFKKLTDAGAADTSRVFVVAELAASGEADFAQPCLSGADQGDSLEAGRAQCRDHGRKWKLQGSHNFPVLARSVYLSFGDLDVKVSDNYFDLLPGETAEITVTSAASLDALKAQMKVISLTDAFAVDPQAAAVTAGR